MKQLLQYIQIELKKKFSDTIIEADNNPGKWYELMIIHEDESSETVHQGDTFDEAFTEVERYFPDYRFDGMNIDIWSKEGPSENVFYFFSVPVLYPVIYDYFKANNELSKMNMVGEVIFNPNHTCSFNSEYAGQGHFYKSEIAFRYFRDVTCYLSESEIEDEESEGSSYNDILELCKGDKTLAQNIFHEVDWQHPSTLYEDWERECLNGASFDERGYLCKCNNCDTIMRDENPQEGARKYSLSGAEVSMERLEDKDGAFWGCPKCLTDDYLKDL